MAEDGMSGFYSYRDSNSNSSTNDFVEDAALDHALLESLFYDMSDGDAGRMDVSASTGTSSSSSTSPFAQFLSEHSTDLNFLGSISRTGTPPPLMGPSIPHSPLPFGSGMPSTPPSSLFRATTPASLLEPSSVDAWSMINSSDETGVFAPEQAASSLPLSSTSLPPALNAGPSAESSDTSGATNHTNPQQQQSRAKQLVSQFATLASRLGISLPPNVLTSLTVLAAQKEESAGDPSTLSGLNHATATTEPSRLAPLGMAPSLQPPPLVPPSAVLPPMHNTSLATPAVAIPTKTEPETIPSSHIRATTTTTTTLPLPLVPNPVASANSFLTTSSRQADTHMMMSPTIDGDSSSLTSELRRTADAAVEAIQQTKKREAPDDETPSASSAAAPTSAQQYSKRKKKPRLDDCERRVADLKRENAMLKRHLNNVLHKTQQFDKERQVAEAKMKTMVRKGASEEELHSVLAKFTEMYSDYGRHRHQELTFHLEQLEKLAAPTTFTKMGLWSLGQNDQFYTDPKRNPIAGILMKELGITPTQGRKIIDNREKVRALCANIKQCLVLLSKLKALCEHKQKLFAGRMAKCQENLTPLQVVKLLIWVDDHSSTLESVCPGWVSERIPRKGSERKKEPPASTATTTTTTTPTTETPSPSLTLNHTSSDQSS